jgi:2-polyprenyl-3-methyl-5-hydroxy-6-metoxy-1,4-benzoquinol methylase
MPKNIILESAIHQYLWAGKRLRQRLGAHDPRSQKLAEWLNGIRFERPDRAEMHVLWEKPHPGSHAVALKQAKFYTRGDHAAAYEKQAALHMTYADDVVMSGNIQCFDQALLASLTAAGIFTPEEVRELSSLAPAPDAHDRKAAEQVFHDEWAHSVDVGTIDVRRINEACTAPEMRYITQALGDLRGKRLLDLGCGLGEAGVYFAVKGADVTATDISPGMLEAAQQLAAKHGVKIRTHVSASEDLGLDPAQPFDIIYAGNLLHHVDIAVTLDHVLALLKPGGTFVSWDPVAYNPVINVYRAIASKVRTPDEHPLTLGDIRLIRSRFAETRVEWFWLTTLVIFISMAVLQFRNPNKERFWKKVIDEADRWAWLYRPLEKLDRLLLRFLPFLRPLCWNVVILARKGGV